MKSIDSARKDFPVSEAPHMTFTPGKNLTAASASGPEKAILRSWR
jgi:hypothetical protein